MNDNHEKPLRAVRRISTGAMPVPARDTPGELLPRLAQGATGIVPTPTLPAVIGEIGSTVRTISEQRTRRIAVRTLGEVATRSLDKRAEVGLEFLNAEFDDRRLRIQVHGALLMQALKDGNNAALDRLLAAYEADSARPVASAVCEVLGAMPAPDLQNVQF